MTQDNATDPKHDTVPAPQEAAPAPSPEPQAQTEPQAEAAAPAPDARIAELEADVAKLKSEVLYARADTENVRRRLEQQADDRGRYAVAQFAKDVLSVADNLRRALDAVPPSSREGNDIANTLTQGVEMTERELLGTFERYGIKPVEAMGARFDPNLHQAMMEVEDPGKPEGTVVMVMQSGYTIHDRLLRPALVGIAKGGPKATGGNVDTSA
jgi:molecular chaperone GrpE